MELEPHQIQKLITCQNYVLTTAVFATDKVKIGDLELYNDTSWNESQNQPIVQRVVSVPKKLVFGHEQRFITLDKGFDASIQNNRNETVAIEPPVKNSMPWRVDIELRKEDVVYVDWLSLANARRENRLFTCEGTDYYLVKYEDIYFKLVDGKPVMLNGWCLFAPMPEEETELEKKLRESGIVIPEIKITNENRKEYGKIDRLALVKHIGFPVYEYLDSEEEEHDEISEGDVVILKFKHNRRLDSEIHCFFSREELIVGRRNRIVGKLTESLF